MLFLMSPIKLVFSLLASFSFNFEKNRNTNDKTEIPPKTQYTLSQLVDLGLLSSMNKLKSTFPIKTPTIKNPSRNPIKLECSLSVSVTKPMEVKTEILIKAKEIPTIAKSSLKNQKSFAKGITKHIQLTKKSAMSIEFLIPILGKNDAKINEQMAIGRSLKPSKTLA